MVGDDFSKNDLMKHLEEMRLHDHLSFVYGSDEQKLPVIAAFLEAGLRRGQRCICIADCNFSEKLTEVLHLEGVAIAEVLDSGALSLPLPEDIALVKDSSFNGGTIFSPGAAIRRLEEICSPVREGDFPALRFTVDIPWIPDKNGEPYSLLEFEAQLHSLLNRHRALAICQYSSAHFPAEILRHIILSHSRFLFKGKICRNPFYAEVPESPSLLEAVSIPEFQERMCSYTKIADRDEVEGDNLKQLINQQADAVAIVDQQSLIRFVNQAAVRMFEMDEGHLVGQNFGYEVDERAEIEIRRPGRKILNAEMRVAEIEWYGETVSLISLRDITRRKENEQALHRANRAMRILTRVRSLLMHAATESELLEAICQLIELEGNYRMTWIGYALDDLEKTVQPVAQSGSGEEYLAGIRISWEDNEYGQGPTGMAIRSGQVAVCLNIPEDPRFTPWREEAERYGYGSSIALPLLIEGGHPLGALNIYAAEQDAFDIQEVEFLKELANDLAYGIQNLRLRKEKFEAEVELERSEAYSNSIIENSLDLITIINSDGTVHYQSPSSEEILGYRPEEIVSNYVFAFVHPEDREGAQNILSLVLANPDSRYAIDLRVRHKDGTWRNLEAIATQILDQDSISQILVNSRDITSRIWAEEQLRHQTHDLEERIKELNCLFSVANILLDYNRSMTDSFQRIVDLIPSSLQYPEIACARLIINGTEYKTDNFQTTPLGVRRGINLYDWPAGLVEFCYIWSVEKGAEPEILPEEEDLMDAIAGQIEGAVFRYQMQEDLRRSEEKYRTLFETMAQGVLYQDTNGRVLSANPAACRMLGLAPEEGTDRHTSEVIDWPAINEQGFTLPEDEYPAMVALREGREVKNFIMGVYNRDERDYRWISANAIPQWHPDEPEPTLVYSTFEDITDVKRTSEQLSYRVSLEQLISEISTSFINLPLDRIDKEINKSLDRVGQFVGVDRSYMFLLSSDGQTVSNTHEWCAEGIDAQSELLQDLSVDRIPWLMKRLGRFEPVQIGSIREMPREASAEKKLFRDLEISSLLCVPMAYGGELKGFLGFDRVYEGRGWSSQDISLLKMLGEVFILALEHMKAEKQLELMALQKVRETFLDNFRMLCRDAREEEPIFEAAASWLAHHLELDRSSIWLLDEDGSQVCHKLYIAGQGEYNVGAKMRLDVSGRYLDLLQALDGTLTIRDIHKDSRFPDLQRQYIEPSGIRALMAAPFKIREKVSGVLFLEQIGVERSWQIDEAQLVKRVADQIAIACDRINERQLREKQQREYTEELENRVVQRTVELEEARRAAEAASLAKSEFLANMSHELRTPLNSVLGFAEIIRDNMVGPTNDKQREYLNDILDSGKHLLNLINDVLDLAKVEAGAMELELETLILDEFFDQCLTMFKEKALKHGIKLSLELEDGVKKMVADRRKFMQVMVNLLSNALKFTPDGGAVGIRTELHGGQLLIEVWDSGIGISRKDQERLFQPFQQLESGKSRKYQGTGLGLSLCRNIVKLHGGNITVESSLGQGSSFIVSIPADPLQREAEGRKQEEDTPRSSMQIQGLKFGVHHLDRSLVMHKNWELGFALLEIRVEKIDNINEVVSLSEVLKKGMRSRDLIIYDHALKSYFLVLSGLEETSAEDTLARFITYLRKEGYESAGCLAFFPEEGKSREELLSALAGKPKLF